MILPIQPLPMNSTVLTKLTETIDLLNRMQIQFNAGQMQELIVEAPAIAEVLKALGQKSLLKQINFMLLLGYLDQVGIKKGVELLEDAVNENYLNQFVFNAFYASRAYRSRLCSLSMGLQVLNNAHLLSEENISAISITKNDPLFTATTIIALKVKQILTDDRRQILINKLNDSEISVLFIESECIISAYAQLYLALILSTATPCELYNAVKRLDFYGMLTPLTVRLFKSYEEDHVVLPMAIQIVQAYEEDRQLALKSLVYLKEMDLLNQSNCQSILHFKTQLENIFTIIDNLYSAKLLNQSNLDDLMKLIHCEGSAKSLIKQMSQLSGVLTQEKWDWILIKIFSTNGLRTILECSTSEFATHFTTQFFTRITKEALNSESKLLSDLRNERDFHSKLTREAIERCQNYSFRYFMNPSVAKMNRVTNQEILIDLKNSVDDRTLQHEFDKQWGLTLTY